MSTLRDLGNEQFKAGQFKEAEALYTQAIGEHSRSDPKVFANRSLTRLRLSDFPGAESDARKAIELYGTKNNLAMKAHYYLAQALLAQRHYSEALIEAKTAYATCLETKDSSAEVIGSFILKCKQEKWKGRETERLRELNATLAYVEGMLDRELERELEDVERRYRQGELGETGRQEETHLLLREAEERRTSVRRGFADKSEPESEERIVPDWLVDPITFEVMHDPVITPTGVSYERVGLLRHIKAVGCDPLTRSPLKPEDLIPNVGLKNAANEFLDKNGWAVDW